MKRLPRKERPSGLRSISSSAGNDTKAGNPAPLLLCNLLLPLCQHPCATFNPIEYNICGAIFVQGSY